MGPYAAVIPQWIAALARRQPLFINGDGTTSRDFCFVDKVVQANLLAPTGPATGAAHAYTVAGGEQTSLPGLFQMLAELFAERTGDRSLGTRPPVFREFFPGDLRHSLADLTAMSSELGYRRVATIREGLRATVDWYCRTLSQP